MSVAIREVCAAVMPGSRQIIPLVIIGAIEKISVIDAIRMLFDKNKNVGCRCELAQFAELMVARIVGVSMSDQTGDGVRDHGVHRKTPAPLVPAGVPLNLAGCIIR